MGLKKRDFAVAFDLRLKVMAAQVKVAAYLHGLSGMKAIPTPDDYDEQVVEM